MNNSKKYDLAIIGTGSAGYTAGIYASRYQLSNIAIGAQLGGQTAEAHEVCNFPSQPHIAGIELFTKIQQQAKEAGTEEIFDTVEEIKGDMGDFTITTATGKTVNSRFIILATGTTRRTLCCPGEKDFIGKGVSYCATCDAMFYQGKTIAVVGGSDAANTASLYLAEIAEKVYQIYRKDQLRGDPTWVEQVMNHPKIEVIFNNNVAKIEGTQSVEYLTLENPYNDSSKIEVNGLFVEIGSVPDQKLAKQLNIDTDEAGYIKVEKDQSTNIPGIWAAGDNTTASNQFRQIITACAEGAIAANSVYTTKQRND